MSNNRIQVTSHNRTSLASFVENLEDVPYGQFSIAIEHDNPQAGIDMLRLCHGKFNNQSYVVADHVFEVPVSALRNYHTRGSRPCNIRLQESSYQYLMQKLEMNAQEYEPEPATQLQSSPYPGPDFPAPEPVVPLQLEFEYATIRHDYNYDIGPYHGIHQYMIVHHGVVNLAALQAARPTRHVSNLISFPPLPPTPCRSPDNQTNPSCRNRCNEHSPLLPAPATSSSGRRADGYDMRQVWLGIMITVLVLGWVGFLSTFQGTLSFGGWYY
jgi:hypothetical protein